MAIKTLNIALIFFVSTFSIKDLSAKTRLSVVSFENKTQRSRCSHAYFSKELGEGFREMLVTKLVKQGRFEVLERQQIRNLMPRLQTSP